MYSIHRIEAIPKCQYFIQNYKLKVVAAMIKNKYNSNYSSETVHRRVPPEELIVANPVNTPPKD
jgi:hypothetical protein